MPPSERTPYRAKSERITEQARDEHNDVYRADPLEVLPLELVINVMQHGLLLDLNFVLKKSWVSRTWRRVLVGCKELWETVTLTGNVGPFDDRIKTLLQRSGGRPTAIKLLSISKSGTARLTKAYDPTFKDSRALMIRSWDNQDLRRVTEKVWSRFHNLTELDIAATNIEYTKDRWGSTSTAIGSFWAPYAIHCDVVPIEAVSRLEHISVRNADFRGTRFRHEPLFRRGIVKPDYSALKSLIVDGCRLDTSPDELARDLAHWTSAGLTPPPAKTCPLDDVLRGANNLSFLQVRFRSPMESSECLVPVTSGGRIELLKLQKAVIPPVSIYPLSIHAPQLQSLSFALFGEEALKAYDTGRWTRHLPLLPNMEDSPVSLEILGQLSHFEMLACSADTIGIVDEWLSYMPKLRQLVVTCVPTPDDVDDRHQRVDLCLLDSLLKNPWCPELEEIHFDGVTVTSTKLTQLVQQRKLAGTPLQTLVINGPVMEDEVCEALSEELDYYHFKRDLGTASPDDIRKPCTCSSD